MPTLATDGYELHREVFPAEELDLLRSEADRIAALESSACVRHLRQKSDLFSSLPLNPRLQALLPADLSPVRSILFDKTPDENWPVLWHQDLTIAVEEEKATDGYGPWSTKDGSPHVQPPLGILARMTTLRLHLDPTPEDNGALRVIPGSHRLGKIPSDEVAPHLEQDKITCTCNPGDVLLMSPLLLHSSRRSLTPTRRRVLHFEFAPRHLLHPELNWLES